MSKDKCKLHFKQNRHNFFLSRFLVFQSFIPCLLDLQRNKKPLHIPLELCERIWMIQTL